MLVPKSKIIIGNLLFENYIKECNIVSSRDNFTETATIVLPNKLRNKNRKVTDFININDPVTIELGYAPNLTLEFTGYVSRVEPDSPAKITCQNEAWVYKQKSIEAFSGKNLKLSELMTAVYDGELVLGTDPEIGDWGITKNNSVFGVLEELRNKYGLLSYWRKDKVLYIAEDFDSLGTVVKFDFQKNIISSDLDFITNAGDIQPVAHGISIQKNNTKIELYAYYENNEIIVSESQPAGILNVMKIPNISKSALENLLRIRLPRLRNQGIQGAFTAFGEPICQHGFTAELNDNKFLERNGSWRIKGVEKNFGTSGYRQKIMLDQKLSV